MEVSESRLAANRANAKLCKGPTSEAGKAISRRNSLKHGMTGSGVVVPEGDQAEVEVRVEALHDELQPRTALGSILIRKIAAFSVRSERAVEAANAEVAARARGAALAFDEERGHRADALLDALPTDPRAALRNLRRMPEGVDVLVESWRGLRRHLDRRDRWGTSQMARAVNLAGVPHLEAHDTRIGDLSDAIWGEFHGLTPDEGGDLDDEARREWARLALLREVDARIAELEAHRGTLDLDRIERDRLEAPSRSAFDDSKSATLARRYEAESDRGFYKALKEFRQVEAEARGGVGVEPGLPTSDRPEPRMDSFRGAIPPAVVERKLPLPDGPKPGNRASRRANEAASRGKCPPSPPV